LLWRKRKFPTAVRDELAISTTHNEVNGIRGVKQRREGLTFGSAELVLQKILTVAWISRLVEYVHW
jgi:hypothetical protein